MVTLIWFDDNRKNSETVGTTESQHTKIDTSTLFDFEYGTHVSTTKKQQNQNIACCLECLYHFIRQNLTETELELVA